MANLKNVVIGIMVVSVLFLAGCATDQGGAPGITGRVVSDVDNRVVATVNGEEIMQEDVTFLKEALLEQGQELSEENIVEQLIMQKLILGEARNRGYVPTTEEAEAELESQLSLQGMTLDRYRERIESQGVSYEGHIEEVKQDIAVNNFVASYLERNRPDVSEEDVAEFYAVFEEQNPSQAPPLEDVREQIVMSLEQQKEQEILNSLLERLRSEAAIVHR